MAKKNTLKSNKSSDIVKDDTTQNLTQTDLDLFPKINISQTDKEVQVTAEIPGIQPEDVDIDVHDTWMAISGVVDRESISDTTYEDMHAEFRREFPLPARVKEKEMKAAHNNGMLSITLPKAE
jgi:HSP20 family protein